MLFGKQVIMLPVMLLDIRFFISIVVRQRKFHTLTLQHVIGSKIVDKIIERFICLYRLRIFRRFITVNRIGYPPDRIHFFCDRCEGVNVCFLVSTSTQYTEQHDPYN